MSPPAGGSRLDERWKFESPIARRARLAGIKLDEVFVPDTPESSASIKSSSQESNFSSGNFLDRINAVRDMLEAVCHGKTEEGRRELGDVGSQTSSQDSAFNYSQTSACSVFMSSCGLNKFIESNLPRLQFDKSDLMSDPKLLLDSLKRALNIHLKKSLSVRTNLESSILSFDKALGKFNLSVNQTNNLLDMSEREHYKLDKLISDSTYLLFLWYWGFPRADFRSPCDYADTKSKLGGDASRLNKRKEEMVKLYNRLHHDLNRIKEKKTFLNAEELCETMHKFNLASALRDLSDPLMSSGSELSHILRLLDAETIFRVPLPHRLTQFPFPKNLVKAALESCEPQVADVACSQMDHRLLFGLVEWVERRLKTYTVQVQVIFNSTLRAKGIMTEEVLKKMELGALKSDLESVESLTIRSNLMKEDAEWTRDLCKYYLMLHVTPQTIPLEVARVAKAFAYYEGQLAMNKAKLEQSVVWLKYLGQMITEEIAAKKNPAPQVTDPLEMILFCPEQLSGGALHPPDEITEPFFFLHCHGDALVSLMGAPHANEIRSLLKGPPPTTEGPRGGGGTIEYLPLDLPEEDEERFRREDAQIFPSLNPDCLLIRSTPALLPEI